MGWPRSRAARGAGIVCATFGLWGAAVGRGDVARAETHAPEIPEGPFPVGGRELGAQAFPPRERTARRPVVVTLHGMCGTAEAACPSFADGATPLGWLVCPRANARCPGGGARWDGGLGARRKAVDDAVTALATRFPGAVDPAAPAILAGFSQGAYLAAQLAAERPGRYPGLLLIGADVSLDPRGLARAGVRRVVLAAGIYDGARPAMDATAERLARAGYPARFVSLGTVGHTYVADRPHALADAFAWLAEDEPHK